MSKIYPFRAMYFNPDFIKDYSKVIAPPEFHLATINELHDYKNVSEYNIYNLLEPLYTGSQARVPKNTTKLTRAERKTTKFHIEQERTKLFDEHFRDIAKKYAGWLETGKIFRDEKPGFYVYERDFWNEKTQSMDRKRSILALLRLEDPEEGTIRLTYKPDEEEIEQAYRLMKITFSQFSPVVVGYSDPKNSVQTLVKQVLNDKQTVFAYDKEGYFHSIRLIHDEGLIDALQKIFNDFQFGIIEGAHTYLAAYKFMQDMKRLDHVGSGTEMVGNVFVHLIALDSEETTDFESPIKVISQDEASELKLRDLNKQTILRISSAASQRIWRRGAKTGTKTWNLDLDEDVDEAHEADLDVISKDAELEGEKNPFALKFIAPRCDSLGVKYFEEDWDLDISKVEREQKKLSAIDDLKQAILFLPADKKILRLSIDQEDVFKNILGRKFSTTDMQDISVFWRNFMKRLYIGFDDDKLSLNIWNADHLKSFIQNTVTDGKPTEASTKMNINEKSMKNSPGYLLCEDDIADNLNKVGVFMLFKDPKADEIVSLIEEGAFSARQVYRLKHPPAIGLITYRMDLSEADDMDEDDEV